MRRATCLTIAATVIALGARSVAAGGDGSQTTRVQQPQTLEQSTATLRTFPLKPDLRVAAAWIGQGRGDRFAPLGRNPQLGETVSLVCDIRIVGNVPGGWKLAFFIDNVKTCGEGVFTIQNPPLCEFTWPFTKGSKVSIDYVAHQLGTHTYTCRVDVANDVVESSETNNSGTASFTIVPLTVKDGIPQVQKLPPDGLKPGPRFAEH